jgi:hypothetical protein
MNPIVSTFARVYLFHSPPVRPDTNTSDFYFVVGLTPEIRLALPDLEKVRPGSYVSEKFTVFNYDAVNQVQSCNIIMSHHVSWDRPTPYYILRAFVRTGVKRIIVANNFGHSNQRINLNEWFQVP